MTHTIGQFPNGRSKCGGYIYMETGALDHLRAASVDLREAGRGWYSSPNYSETYNAQVSQLPSRNATDTIAELGMADQF